MIAAALTIAGGVSALLTLYLGIAALLAPPARRWER